MTGTSYKLMRVKNQGGDQARTVYLRHVFWREPARNQRSSL